MGYYQRFDGKDIFLGTVNSIDFDEAMNLARKNVASGKVKSLDYYIVKKSLLDNTEQILYANHPKENALEKDLKTTN